MRRQLFLLCALSASAAYSAQLDMALFDEEDQNKDGYVHRVEAKGSVDLQARFKDIDLNRDGQLTRQEMNDWIGKAE